MEPSTTSVVFRHDNDSNDIPIDSFKESWSLGIQYLSSNETIEHGTDDSKAFAVFSKWQSRLYERACTYGHGRDEAIDAYVLLQLWRLQKGICPDCQQRIPLTDVSVCRVDPLDNVCATIVDFAQVDAEQRPHEHVYNINCYLSHSRCHRQKAWLDVAARFDALKSEYEAKRIRLKNLAIRHSANQLNALNQLYSDTRQFVEKHAWTAEYGCLGIPYDIEQVFKKHCQRCNLFQPLTQFRRVRRVPPGALVLPDDVSLVCLDCLRSDSSFVNDPIWYDVRGEKSTEVLEEDEDNTQENAVLDDDEEDQRLPLYSNFNTNPNADRTPQQNENKTGVLLHDVKSEGKCGLCNQQLQLMNNNNDPRSMEEQLEANTLHNWNGSVVYNAEEKCWTHRLCRADHRPIYDAKRQLLHTYDQYRRECQAVQTQHPALWTEWCILQQTQNLIHVWKQAAAYRCKDMNTFMNQLVVGYQQFPALTHLATPMARYASLATILPRVQLFMQMEKQTKQQNAADSSTSKKRKRRTPFYYRNKFKKN